MLKSANMRLFIAVCLSIVLADVFDLLSYLANAILTLHKQCLVIAPDIHQKPLIQALLCGRSLAKGPLYSALQSTGLLHLIVVSGAHLVFIEQNINFLCRKLKLLEYFRLPLLVAFSFATNFQPPIARALCFRLFRKLSRSLGLNHPPLLSSLLSGLVLLAFIPQWSQSYSFHLSWVAQLALLLGSEKKSRFQQFAIYFLLLPLLIPLGPPHPFSIFLNLLVTPLIGFLLIPAALFACLLFPLWPSSVEFIWRNLELFFLWLGQVSPDSLYSSPLPGVFLYSFALQFFFCRKFLR